MRFSIWPSPAQPLARDPRADEALRSHRVGRRLLRRPPHAQRARPHTARRRHDRVLVGDRRPRRHRPPPAAGVPREQRHLPAPGGAGQHRGGRRQHQRWPAVAGDRCRLAGERARRLRHPSRVGEGAARPFRGGLRGHHVAAPRTTDHLHRRLLPDHRRPQPAATGARAPADPHRRRGREANHEDRRPLRRRVERLDDAGRAGPQGGRPAPALRRPRTRSWRDQHLHPGAAVPVDRRELAGRQAGGRPRPGRASSAPRARSPTSSVATERPAPTS